MIEQLHQTMELIQSGWSRKRILVAGDVMLDKYVRGEVQRISPEAPVPIVRTTRQSHQPGGAANVAMNLAELGAQTTLVGFVGEDHERTLLEDSLRESQITPALIPCPDFPTITKLRILGGPQQMLRLDHESLSAHSAADHEILLRQALGFLTWTDALILSDYGKGTLSESTCQTLIQAARRRGIPVLVDPKSADFSHYRGATTITPNRTELRAATGLARADIDTLLLAAEDFPTKYDLDFLAPTLSERGIALLWSDRCFLAPAQARQVFDVSGAGDTVIAVIALGLASGLSPEDSARLANLAAGIVVGKSGTVPVKKHELLAALNPTLSLHAHDKIVSAEALSSRADLWKQNGERIVITNGCFDLLHVGHITLLEEARSFGDRLIVAINSDASIQQLKGPSRPVVGQNERARVLAALAAIDAVVIFDEPTPLQLIEQIHPDILVKGGDYTLESIVGASEVLSWGGEVRIVPTLTGYSSSRLIQASAAMSAQV